MKQVRYSNGKVNLRPALLALTAGLCACQKMPEPYAPPVQRQPFVDYHPRLVSMVTMEDPDAPKRFVQDISNSAVGTWRWVEKRPTVRLRLSSNKNLKYTVDFTLPDVTFKETGPVTITFYVTDHVLDQVHYPKPGYQHFEKAVPPEWVTPNEFTQVGAEIDKTWFSKDDNTTYGFILTRIGLTQ